MAETRPNVNADAPCLTPVQDTWDRTQHVAQWSFALQSPPETWTNEDIAAHLDRFLAATAPWTRVRRAWIDTEDPTRAGPHDRGDQSSTSFHAALADTIRTDPAHIPSLDLTLDLWAWVRTAEGTEPVQGWVDSLAHADLALANGPYVALGMDHTLFADGGTNRALHERNQPVLAEILAALGEAFGPLEDVEVPEGMTGIGPTGFAPRG